MRICLLLLLIVPRILLAESTANERIRSIQLRGFSELQESELRRLVGIKSGEAYSDTLCPRVSERIIKRYQRMGFSKVEVLCEFVEVYHARGTLKITIREGEPDLLESVELKGELPPDLKSTLERYFRRISGRPYSDAIRREIQRQILYLIRLEGFLFASVATEFSGGKLTVSPNIKEKVELRFGGNDTFKTSELVALLGLERRVTPFSRRTINAFSEQLREFYEANGFFFASVSVEERGNEYLIYILEGPRVILGEVRIQGNNSFPLLELKILKVGEKVTHADLVQELFAIQEYYHENGFLDVKVNLRRIDESPTLSVHFEIEEGEQVKISEIVSDKGCLADQILFDDLKEQPVSDELIKGRKSVVEAELQKLGYPQGAVKVLFDKDGRRLEVSVTCGARHIIKGLKLVGLAHTKEEFVRKILQGLEGRAWSRVAIEEKISHLRETGLFTSVRYSVADGSLDSLEEELLINLEERDTGVLDSSLSFNTEDGLRLGGELSQRNFGGVGQTVSLLADLYLNDGPGLFDAGRARAFYRVPSLFDDEKLELLSEAYFQYDIQTVNQFNFSRIGIDSQIRRKHEQFIFSAGLSLFQDDVKDVLADTILTERDTGETLYGFFVTKAEYDARDSSLLPTRGFYASLLGKFSHENLASEVSIASVSSEFKYYTSILDSFLVLANGAKGIILEPFGDTEVIPISQRLFLGGNRTLRGFGRNRLSPLGLNDGRAGGDRDYVLNSELQMNLPNEVQFALFIDAGEVRIENGGADLRERSSDFRIAPGLGLRYRSPVGAIGADLGFPVDKREGEASPRVYVGFNGIF